MIGYVSGVFDLFHVGHLNLVRRARSQCDYLIAGVSTDELTESLKGRPPVTPLLERIEIMQSVRYVDHVVPQVSVNKLDAWRNLLFDVVFAGDNWRGSDRWLAWESQFAEAGVSVIYLPYTRTTSSVLLREVAEEWDLS